MSLTAGALHAAVLSVARFSSSEEGEHASAFLGISNGVWQVLNLVLFVAVLVYFVARPMAAAFRKRQEEIEERRKVAEKQRADVDRLSTDIRERTAKLEREIEEIRKQAVVEGESARADLARRADEEAARVGQEAQDEIGRRLAAAREMLKQTAADLTAGAAEGILAREVTDADRQRLLAEGVEKVKTAR